MFDTAALGEMLSWMWIQRSRGLLDDGVVSSRAYRCMLDSKAEFTGVLDVESVDFGTVLGGTVLLLMS